MTQIIVDWCQQGFSFTLSVENSTTDKSVINELAYDDDALDISTILKQTLDSEDSELSWLHYIDSNG